MPPIKKRRSKKQIDSNLKKVDKIEKMDSNNTNTTTISDELELNKTSFLNNNKFDDIMVSDVESDAGNEIYINSDEEEERKKLKEEELMQLKTETVQSNNEGEKVIKTKKDKKYKTGIIFLTRIPKGRNYTRLREIFSRYGEVGNIYLVPDKYANERLEKKGKAFKCYAEGFIEFKKKKTAKMVAELLNGQPLEKSKNGVKGFIWDIRYLHRVKWHHLMAKLKHTKALEEQRIRFETEKAKDSAEHYLEMVQEWKRRDRNGDFINKAEEKRIDQLVNRQRPTKKDILEVKVKVQKHREEESMDQLYKTLFG